MVHDERLKIPAAEASRDLGHIGAWILIAAFFTAPMMTWKLSDTAYITVADVLVLLAYLALIRPILMSRMYVASAYLVGAVGLIVACLLSLVFVGIDGHTYSGLSRTLFTAVLLPLPLIWWRPERRTLGLLGLAYVAGNVISVLWGLFNGDRADGRIVGMAPHPNGLGHACLIALVLLPFIMTAFPNMRRSVIAALALVNLIGLNQSGSRGSLVAFAVVVVIAVVLERSTVGLALLVGATAVGLMLFSSLVARGGDDALGRLLGGGSADAASGQREEALERALAQISMHPFIGNGFDSIREAHNIYLQTFASLGLLGVLSQVLIVASAAVAALRPGPLRRLGYVAVAFVVLGPLTDSVWDTFMWLPMSLALVAASYNAPPRPDPVRTTQRRAAGSTT